MPEKKTKSTIANNFASGLVSRVPFFASCLFLAWVMVQLTIDVTGTEVDCFSAAINHFIDAYNQCGYYDVKLAYLENGNLLSRTSGFFRIQLWGFFSFLLSFSGFLAGICKKEKLSGWEVVSCYLISGMLLGMILLVGKIPSYQNLIFLLVGWMYLHLVRAWTELKGKQTLREFLGTFPKSIFVCYAVLLAGIFAMPHFLPVEKLPKAQSETKQIIFEKMQEFHLITSQYEENQERNRIEQEIENASNAPTEEILFAESEPSTERNPADLSGEDSVEQESFNFDPTGEDSTEQDGFDFDSTEKNPGVWEEFASIWQNRSTALFGYEGIGSEDSRLTGNLNGSGSGSGSGKISGGRTDRIGNLQFTGKTVFTAYSEEKPDEMLYIRFFYAENYQKNRWEQSEKTQTIPVFYTLQNSDASIVSSTSSLSSSSGSATSSEQGDGTEDTATTTGLSEDAFLQLKMGTADLKSDSAEKSGNSNQGEKILVSSSRFIEQFYPETRGYRTKTCQVVPENLQQVLKDEFSQFLKQSSINWEHTAGEKMAEHFSEEQIASWIEQFLEERAYYTLSPGQVPKGKDFITWFLTEKKCGYCMHFASAGVMLLRQEGISSRYAEGYVVPVSAWKQSSDGSWVADVKDQNAHAWAEIYMDGWKPVEMTPAYEGELAGDFAGEHDQYLGRWSVPAVVIVIAKWFLRGILAVGILIFVRFFYRKGTDLYEYSLLHTGNRNRDVQNMLRLTLMQYSRKSFQNRRLVKQALNQKNITKQEFIDMISKLWSEADLEGESDGKSIKKELGGKAREEQGEKKEERPEKGQEERQKEKQRIETAIATEGNKNRKEWEWFVNLTEYAYEAAFGEEIGKEQRVEALCLYGKIKKQRISQKKIIYRKKIISQKK